MSNDPRINSALFNFCVAADDGPRQQPSDDGENKEYRASTDDLDWLKDVMKNVEAPDRTIKRHITTILTWSESIKSHVFSGAAYKASVANANSKKIIKNPAEISASLNKPPLMLPAPRASSTSTSGTTNNNFENKVESSSPSEEEQSKKTKEQQQQQKNEKDSELPILPLSDLPKITDDILDAVEEMADLCEDLNYAKEFMLLKGVPLFLGLIKVSTRSAMNSNNNKSSNTDPQQKQWSEFRTILARCLAGSSANFDEFQLEMCKFDFASALVPLLSKKEEYGLKFPAELGAVILCLTNTIRSFPPSMNEFLFKDGMFHLANAIEFLRDATTKKSQSSTSTDASLLNHFAVAQRRAFSFARYLIEEHAVTSPRVLKACADIILRQTLGEAEENANDKNKDSKSSQNENGGKGSEDTDEDEMRLQENLNTTAFFATIILVSALKRSAVTNQELEKKNKEQNQVSGVNLMMQQWGRYVGQKLSGAWWQKFSSKKKEDKVVVHHDLNEGVVDLVEGLREAKKNNLGEAFTGF